MSNPWEIKQSDKRVANTLMTFIIFCEDEVSEPLYFKFFETSKIKVNPIRNQKSMMVNVVNAICHCQENNLLEETEEKLFVCKEGNQVWCVFDRDLEEIESKQRKGNILFDESIKTALGNGIKLAWSNDSFELWVLLHFESVDFELMENKNRELYYDKLTKIFKNIQNPNEDLLKVLQYKGFSYKESLKRENNFRNIVRPEMIKNTKIAIERSKELESKYSSKNISEHEKSPFTLVHHLVEELIKYGEKEIAE
jgi:hypothetical protein